MLGIALVTAPASIRAGTSRVATPPDVPAAPASAPYRASTGPRGAPRPAQTSAPAPPGSAAPAPAAVGEVYTDRVLDDSPADPPDPVADAGPADDGPLGPGRRVISLDWTFLHERDDGRVARETGVAASWRRETLDYGFLSAEVAGRLEDDGSVAGDDHRGGRFSLRQEDFVLGGELLSDTVLGDQIVTANPLLTRSFRFNLPSSYLRGAGARLHDATQELRVQAGAVGDLSGDRLLTYESSGAALAGIGYTRRLSPAWSAGLQFFSLRNDPATGNHHTLAAALEHRQGDERSVQLRGLRDSGGNLGLWLDGDHGSGAWRHRYGVFRFDRGLQWLDDGIANDRQGFYWRSDRRSARYDLSAGVDLAQTNVDAAPDLAGSVTASTFVRGTWLLRRDTQLGGSLDLRATRDGSGLPVVEQNRTDARAFVSRRWALGTTRLQADTVVTRGSGLHDNRYELLLDHAWDVTGARLSTRLRTGRERGTGGDADLLSLGALASLDVGRDLSFNGDASASVVSGEGRHTRALRLGLGMVWQLSRQWRLDLEQELVDQRVRGGGVSEGETSLELFARLRWSETSGREPPVLGQPSGLPGSGRIVGVVFLDENRDGLRSPGEEVVSGAVLELDAGRARARTDGDGRYEFWPVFTGGHEVRLRTEELPLPWGLLDDSPVAVTVAARETVRLDFALVRLDE